ncbi:MAG: transposase, partial [Nitrososphaerota archaeon]
MGVDLAHLIKLFSDRSIFPRCRFPVWVKALAVRLYSEGLSLRRVSEVFSELGLSVSYESIRIWFHKAGCMLSYISRRRRGFIAVDETVIYNLARRAYLWAAREVRTKEVIAIHVSRGRGLGECIKFIEAVKDACSNKPTLYTDRAGWYEWPIRLLGMRRRKKTFG